MLEVTELELRTWPFRLMSMRITPEGPTLEPLSVAWGPVKVTKLAKFTREPQDSKSSTIHSALTSPRLPCVLLGEIVSETVLPDSLSKIVLSGSGEQAMPLACAVKMVASTYQIINFGPHSFFKKWNSFIFLGQSVVYTLFSFYHSTTVDSATMSWNLEGWRTGGASHIECRFANHS